MRFWSITVVLLCSAVAIAGESKDPYPGSGGLYMGAPSHEDVQSGRSVYSEEKISSLKVGVTTKQQAVDIFGEPANWSHEPDGTSMMEYAFVEAEGMLGLRRIVRLQLSFDKHLLLSKIQAPHIGK